MQSLGAGGAIECRLRDRFPLPSPLLPWWPQAFGNPRTELASYLTSYLCLYPCLSPKEKTLEHLFQRRQSGHSRLSFSPDSKNTSTKESSASGHLCKSLAPDPFLFTTTPLISFREPHLAVPTPGRNMSGFVM